MTLENLTKALHSANSARAELQDALHTADPVAGLVILPIIWDAARLAEQISALLSAMQSTE